MGRSGRRCGAHDGKPLCTVGKSAGVYAQNSTSSRLPWAGPGIRRAPRARPLDSMRCELEPALSLVERPKPDGNHTLLDRRSRPRGGQRVDSC